ncbi:hypothetical protein FRC16_002232 [Serendipita sp. 398]|nr:hypothetical protein FRC16_002232 [Serendipita sp. 398]
MHDSLIVQVAIDGDDKTATTRRGAAATVIASVLPPHPSIMGFPALGSSITDLASQYRATQFTAVAVITLWAYDYLLTFADEVELVWKKRQFSWTKVLFSIVGPHIDLHIKISESLPTRQIHIGSLRE